MLWSSKQQAKELLTNQAYLNWWQKINETSFKQVIEFLPVFDGEMKSTVS